MKLLSGFITDCRLPGFTTAQHLCFHAWNAVYILIWGSVGHSQLLFQRHFPKEYVLCVPKKQKSNNPRKRSNTVWRDNTSTWHQGKAAPAQTNTCWLWRLQSESIWWQLGPRSCLPSGAVLPEHPWAGGVAQTHSSASAACVFLWQSREAEGVQWCTSSLGRASPVLRGLELLLWGRYSNLGSDSVMLGYTLQMRFVYRTNCLGETATQRGRSSTLIKSVLSAVKFWPWGCLVVQLWAVRFQVCSAFLCSCPTC